MATQSDSITCIDDSTTNTTEPSEAAIPCEIPQNTIQSKVRKHKPLLSELSPELLAFDEHQLLRGVYTELRGGKLPEQHKSLSIIPKFYSKPPREGSCLSQKLREEARSRFLKEKSTQLLDNQEVQIYSIY